MFMLLVSTNDKALIFVLKHFSMFTYSVTFNSGFMWFGYLKMQCERRVKAFNPWGGILHEPKFRG